MPDLDGQQWEAGMTVSVENKQTFIVGREARSVLGPYCSVAIYDLAGTLIGTFSMDEDTGHVCVADHWNIIANYHDNGIVLQNGDGDILFAFTAEQIYRLTGTMPAAWPKCKCLRWFACDCERPDWDVRPTGYMPYWRSHAE